MTNFSAGGAEREARELDTPSGGSISDLAAGSFFAALEVSELLTQRFGVSSMTGSRDVHWMTAKLNDLISRRVKDRAWEAAKKFIQSDHHGMVTAGDADALYRIICEQFEVHP